MAVCFDSFMEWATDRFGAENIKLKNTPHGTEVCTHSYFAERKGIEDNKYHLWMNPSGGKGKRQPGKGSYRCWKTDAMGTLVQLVAEYDSIDYDEAEELICGATSLRSLEKKLEEFFSPKVEAAVEIPETPRQRLELPDWSFLITGMSDSHHMKRLATEYLAKRGLPPDGLYVCTNGDHKNRIVIPYYGKAGELIWFNARAMQDGKNVLRYMKCRAEGLSQDDVLYMTSWPEPGTKVYIMEGEIDALSVARAGLVGCAVGGKSLSDTQAEMLRSYQPVLAFDADSGVEDHGLNAMIRIGRDLLGRGISCVRYVRPPRALKDWNKMLSQHGAKLLGDYVAKFEKPFTEDTPAVLLSRQI